MASISTEPSCQNLRAATMLALFLLATLWTAATAQTIVNPGFQDGTSGWNGCPLEINPANVYGGPDGDLVAEVDGHNDPNATSDDRQLCQTITGFTVGSVYALEFYAARRQGGPTPLSPSVNVSLDGVLDATVTRSGGWNMQKSSLLFTAASTSHYLHITPNFTVSYGMLFDNFSITLVSALPVELMYFQASTAHDAVTLEWATATERNNARFAVERSTDNVEWAMVAQVPGAGDSQTTRVYSVIDRSPASGLSYYRLVQVDLDGTETQLRSIAVERPVSSGKELWPNPARDVLFINAGPINASSATVIDALGRRSRVIMRREDDLVVLDVAALPNGHYRILLGPDPADTWRFIKM